MKNFFLILIVSASIFAQQEPNGRVFTQSEIDEMVREALNNNNVSNKMTELLNQGYSNVKENSTGGIRATDGASFVNLAFNKGDNTLTTHILYAKKGNEIFVTFLEGTISNNDGALTNVVSYDIINGGDRGIDRTYFSNGLLGCIAAGCAGAAVGCLFTNCAYLQCLVGGCLAAAVVCILCAWWC